MTATTLLSTARRRFAQRIAATLAADPRFQADWAVYRALSIAGGQPAGLRLMLADDPPRPSGVLGMDPSNPFEHSDVLADDNGGGGGDVGPDPGFPGGDPGGGDPGGGDPFPPEPGGNDPWQPPGPAHDPPFTPFTPDTPDLVHPWPTYPVAIHFAGHPRRD